ncbi:uncharacterized protein [Hoplias malabaricus]|uniref:uncharacterized protein isoform X3 n=1 Tax=Hoplias malabaricus TaxID=27720 RepID=UPI0034637AF2
MAWRSNRLWMLLIALCLLRNACGHPVRCKGLPEDQLSQWDAGSQQLQKPGSYFFEAKMSTDEPNIVFGQPSSTSGVIPQISQDSTSQFVQTSSQLAPSVGFPASMYFGVSLPGRQSDSLVSQAQFSGSTGNQLQQQGALQQVSSSVLQSVSSGQAYSSQFGSSNVQSTSSQPGATWITFSQRSGVPQASQPQGSSSQQIASGQQVPSSQQPGSVWSQVLQPLSQSQGSLGQVTVSQQVPSSQQPGSVSSQVSQQSGMSQGSLSQQMPSGQLVPSPQQPGSVWTQVPQTSQPQGFPSQITVSQQVPSSQQPISVWSHVLQQLPQPQGSLGQVIVSQQVPSAQQPGSVSSQVSQQSGVSQGSSSQQMPSGQLVSSPQQPGSVWTQVPQTSQPQGFPSQITVSQQVPSSQQPGSVWSQVLQPLSQPQGSLGQVTVSQQVPSSQQPGSVSSQVSQQSGVSKGSSSQQMPSGQLVPSPQQAGSVWSQVLQPLSQPQGFLGQVTVSQQVPSSQQPGSVSSQVSQQSGLSQGSKPQGSPSQQMPSGQLVPSPQQAGSVWSQVLQPLSQPQGSLGQVTFSQQVPSSQQPGSVWSEVSWQAGVRQASSNVATVSSPSSPVQVGPIAQMRPVSQPLHPPQSLGGSLASTAQGSPGAKYFSPSQFPPQAASQRTQVGVHSLKAKLFTSGGKPVVSGSLRPVNDVPKQTVPSQDATTSQASSALSQVQSAPSSPYGAQVVWFDKVSQVSQPSEAYDLSQMYSSSFSGGQQQSGFAVGLAQAQQSPVAQGAPSGSATSTSPGSYGTFSSQISAADAISGSWSGPSVAQVASSDSASSVTQSTSGSSSSAVAQGFYSGSQIPSSTGYSFYQHVKEPSYKPGCRSRFSQ